MNVAWAVPRNRRPNPFASRARSLLLLVVGGVTLVLTGLLSSVGNDIAAFTRDLGSWLRITATLASIVINSFFFGFVFRVSTARAVPWKAAMPGAVGAAIAWQLLQSFGTTYVGEVVRRADATNGVFAIVLGLIAWIYLAAVAVLLCVQSNVVFARHLYPRTLLTPFTDDVDLTDADQRAYASYAKAQRTKGFESVEVTFEHDGQYATASRNQDAASLPGGPAHHGGDGSSDDGMLSEDDPGHEPRVKEL